MNKRITIAKVKAKRLQKKARTALNRRFNINFSLKRKNEPDNPLLSVNVKGEIPKELIAIFAFLGAVAILCAVIKILRRIL